MALIINEQKERRTPLQTQPKPEQKKRPEPRPLPENAPRLMYKRRNDGVTVECDMAAALLSWRERLLWDIKDYVGTDGRRLGDGGEVLFGYPAFTPRQRDLYCIRKGMICFSRVQGPWLGWKAEIPVDEADDKLLLQVVLTLFEYQEYRKKYV